jgi:hypothetical protein
VVFIIDFFPPVGFEISLLDKVALILHQMGFVLKVMFKVSFKVILEANTMVSLEVIWYTLLLLEVKVNLRVNLQAFPEVSLEVEVEVDRTLPICLDSECRVLRVSVRVM